jgi:type 1 fimbria pilin
MKSKDVGNVLNCLFGTLPPLLVGFLAILIATPTHAAVTCDYTEYSGSPITFYVDLPSVLKVPRDAPIGAVLFTQSGSAPYEVVYRCSGDFIVGMENDVGNGASVARKTDFPIGDTGLAWSLEVERGGGGEIPDIKWGIKEYNPSPSSTTWHIFDDSIIRVRIKKIGRIKTGSVIPDRVLGWLNVQNQLYPLRLRVSNRAVVGNPSCKTPDVTVKMGDRNMINQFNGVGTSLAPVNFAIALRECPEGIRQVRYQLKPNTNIVNIARSVVSLEAGSIATGVGVQLLENDGSPIPLRDWIRFSEYDSRGGNFDIPLKAAYFQTEPVINPGTANTSITFEMSYD